MIKILLKHLKGYYISKPQPLITKLYEFQELSEPTIRTLVLNIFKHELDELRGLELIQTANLTAAQLDHFSSEQKEVLRESSTIFLIRGDLKNLSGSSQYIIQLPEVETHTPDFAFAKSLLTHSNPGIRKFAKETLGDSDDSN